MDHFRNRTEWTAHANSRQYEAPADPWELISVDPSAVERYATRTFLGGLGRVHGGEWDLPENCQRIAETGIYEGLVDRFVEGDSWEESAYYTWAEKKFEEHDSLRGYESLEAFMASRPEDIEDLYNRITENGYRPNIGTRYETVGDIEYVHEMEPVVLIGRDGEIIWTEGYHRLVLAKLLDVDEIPVYVMIRHVDWQRIRDEFATTPPGERDPELAQYADHPDLRDVREAETPPP